MKGKASKYKHIFGTPFQLRDCYGDIRVGNASPESNPIAANKQFFAVPWTTPGSICVVPLERKGAVSEETPLVLNEADEGDPGITDLRFCPFDDHLIGAASQDGTAKIWRVPQGGLTENITTPEVTLAGNGKRLLNFEFHPLAAGIVVTSGADYTINVWNATQSSQPFAVLPKHKGLVTSLSFNYDGSLLASSSKDKQLRVFDPRANKIAAETASHDGAKSGKVSFVGKGNLLVAAGFAKNCNKEIHLHDLRNLSAKLATENLGSSTSTPLIFFDNDLSLLYLSGKGDGTIKIYEVPEDSPSLGYLNEYKSKEPTSGIAGLPKFVNNTKKVEVQRFLKLTPNQVIPIRFEIPRANMDLFHDDLYPPTWDEKSTMSCDEWLAGANKPRSFAPVPHQ